jgi:transcriptional regulator with GAF, ATPase, and Fis domain
MVGADSGLKQVMNMVRQVAPVTSPVLLVGETGVGKEVIANAILNRSNRKDKPFIKVNGGAIPENLIDSELFGHEKGAFTGAIAQKRGRFERADKGTIFLDEIGDLHLQAQTRLLRVIQQKEIERVGGIRPIPVDVRIIAATHRDLEEMIDEGRFREDLWFRLNIFPIMIPPLRQRKDDIPGLVHHFIERKSKELKIHSLPKVLPESMERLKAYHWPGNVRELENLVERALIQCRGKEDGRTLTFDHFLYPAKKGERDADTHKPYELLSFDVALSRHIRKALQLTHGKIYGKDGAARLLEINPNTLRSKMKKMGISPGAK